MTQGTAPERAERLRLGGAEYLWSGGQLQNDRGRRVPLRAKSLRMFAALLSERGTVLSKDRLSDLVWPGAIATDESIARCIADIRKVLSDGSHEIVETFPKQGYRLNVAAAFPVSKPASQPRRADLVIAAATGAIVLLGAGMFILETRHPIPETLAVQSLAEPELRDAVAILPFSAQAEADAFLAAGLSDDLEMRLAEMSRIKIVSQALSSAIADGSANPVALARSLDARFLVHGSVRRNGSAIAVSLQLIDGTDGTMLWADRYEGAKVGLLDFRDTLPEALVEAMSIELNPRDRRRLALQDTDDSVAFEEVMRARRALSTFTYEGTLSAERHLRRAVARDPDYARAYAELASAYVIRMENDWIVLSREDVDKAFHFAAKALELDPDLWFAHYSLGRLHSVASTGDVETGLRHLRTAMALQPENDDARIYFAVVTAMSGRLGEGLAIFESVMATHPQPPFWYYLGLGNALFHLHRYDEAAEVISTCLQQMPNSPYCLRIQIATLTRMGRLDDAAWAKEEYAILGHETTLDAVMQTAIERDPAMRRHLRDSYRLAGFE